MTDRLNAAEIHHISALKALGKSNRAISRATGRDPKTVAKNLKTDETAKIVEAVKTELSAEFENLARRMVNSITDDDISKINAYQRTIAASAATDKFRLLSNQSTSNSSIMLKAVLDSFRPNNSNKPEAQLDEERE